MSLFLSHKTLLADRHAWLKWLYSFLFLSGFRVQLRPAQMDKSLVGFLFLFLPCSSSSFSLSSFSGGWKSVYSSETLSSSSAVGVWNAMPADIRFQTHQHFKCPTPSSLFPSVSTCKALRVPSTETPGPGTETPALALALSPHRLRRGQMLCPPRSKPGQSSPIKSGPGSGCVPIPNSSFQHLLHGCDSVPAKTVLGSRGTPFLLRQLRCKRVIEIKAVA